MASETFLIVCESFYSIQGEGLNAGVPAVFLRLSGCNLRCEGFSYRDPETGEHLGCDTKKMWRSGKRAEFSAIIQNWQQQGWLEKLKQGAHLVITGGEPLLQQHALTLFIARLETHCETKIFIEMETNGTLWMNEELLQRINQFNVSPKLANSLEPKSKAYQPAVLKQLFQTDKAVLKFVISSAHDVDEILENFIIPFQFNRRKVWLMPEGGTPSSINAKKLWLVELCKQHVFNFTSRLHIDIWHEVTGV